MNLPRALSSPLERNKEKSPALLTFRRALFGLIAVALLFLWKEIWTTAFLSVLGSFILSYPVRLFSRFTSRGAATLLTLLLGIGAAVAVAPVIVTPFVDQAREAQRKIPDAIRKGKDWLRNSESAPRGGGVIPSGAAIAKGVEKQTQGLADTAVNNAGTALLGVTSAGATLIVLVVLSLFFVHEPDTYRDWLKAMVPREHEGAFNALWSRLGEGLRKWVQGILVSMTLMGTFTAVGLKLVGVQNWLLLGVLTFFGTFIPYVGAIASAVPGLLVALAQSPRLFLLAAAVYLGVHIVEGYIVQPFVMKRAVTIQPAILLLWQLIMGVTFGLPGVIVATPVYVCLKIALDLLYVERQLEKEPYPPRPEPGRREEEALFEKTQAS